MCTSLMSICKTCGGKGRKMLECCDKTFLKFAVRAMRDPPLGQVG